MPGISVEPHPSAEPLLQVLVDACDRGSVILAPNERAARDLRGRFAARQTVAGLATWTPPRILTWSSWTGSLWSTLVTTGAEPRLLLNAAQEHSLWREVIQTGPALESLGSIDALASLAANAWSLAAEYGALESVSRAAGAADAGTHDTRTFSAWSAVFRTQCAARQYLSAAERNAALRVHIERKTLTVPRQLLLIAFEGTLTPAQQLLLNALAKAGCEIQRHTPGAPPATQLTVRCEDPQQEILTAAYWIRNFIQAGTTNGEPPRVALIVPQLDNERPAIEATLREILAPELQNIEADLSAGPVAFSSGTPLAESALIAAALDLIHWLSEPLDQRRVTALLLSAYFGHTADLPARAEFDAFHLRQTQRLRPELTLAQFLRLADREPDAASKSEEGWTAFLRPLAHRSTQLTSNLQRPYADWMEFLRAALREANWPGDRPLTAQEFNAVREWEHVLDSVATLDFAGNRVPFVTALEALDRQARGATTTTTQADAVVRVMRPSEAAGTTFDATIFLHATDALWPTPVRPNPFLSWSLQRELKMPGTDLALATASATETTAHLVASTPISLFFYPSEDETGVQRLSPIVAALGWRDIPAAELMPTPPVSAVVATEALPDAADLPALPSSQVSGGARVLKLQAACGFLAFAELRLGSAPIDSATPGFDALENGNFLHRTMQAVWHKVGTQENLRQLTPQQRGDLLSRAIDASVSRHIHPETGWDRAYLQLQKDRLFSVLQRWLDAELERGPFSVLSLEQKTEVSLGPLTLSVRVDRIDQVDGGFVFVDYKTGASAGPRHWDGERPEDPQLPLYALLSEPGELKGIAFAKVRAGKSMSWLGYQADPGILPMKRAFVTNIDEAIERWRQDLTFLAEDFANGRATVHPRDFAVDCARCAQRLLCRVNPELLLAALAEDEAEEDAE